MDERLKLLNDSHGAAANILCVEGGLEKALQLGSEGGRYFPLQIYDSPHRDQAYEVADIQELYLGFDDELSAIPNFFRVNPGEGVFYSLDKGFGDLIPNHLLNLPNTAGDVRHRQEGVRELVERDDLYQFIEEVLAGQVVYSRGTFERSYKINVTPEKTSNLIRRLAEINKFSPESGPLKKLVTWAGEVSGDTLFGELVRDKRRVTDRRIFTGYSERFKGVAHYLLKPGVNLEDVFDIINPRSTYRDTERVLRSGRKKNERRRIIKFKDPLDERIRDSSVEHARQRMDVLNEFSAKMLGVPGLLTLLQLKQLYQGAYMHKTLNERGVPMTFPEIVDKPGVLELGDFLPTRMVLSEREGEENKERLQSNTLNLSPNQRIVQVEGPNYAGKSEAWRSIHLINGLTNAGYSIPARSARMSITPNSHFISFKGDKGHGGSELARSFQELRDGLRDVHSGDTVILDELGDASNAPTSREIAKRILPQLLKNGSRVFVTSHHGSATDYIERELRGVSLVPDPKGREEGRYRLVSKDGPVNFRAGETLDRMNFTSEKVSREMPGVERLNRVRRLTRIEKHGEIGEIDEIDDDTPF